MQRSARSGKAHRSADTNRSDHHGRGGTNGPWKLDLRATDYRRRALRHGDRRVSPPRVVILACATSAGIHGAFAPEHFEEGTGAGTGFVAATVLLAALAVALTQRPTSGAVLSGATFVLAGLIGSYALAVTTGMPVLHPEVEPVDGLAAFHQGNRGDRSRCSDEHPLALPPRHPEPTTERNLT